MGGVAQIKESRLKAILLQDQENLSIRYTRKGREAKPDFLKIGKEKKKARKL